MRTLFTLLLLITMLTLAACGGDDGDDGGDIEPLPTLNTGDDQPETTPDTVEPTPEVTDEPTEAPAPTDAPEATDEAPASGGPPFGDNGGSAPPFANTPSGDAPSGPPIGDTGGAPGGPPIGNPGGAPGGPPTGGNSGLPPGVGDVAPGGLDRNFAVSVSGDVNVDLSEGAASFALTPARDAAGTLIPEHLTLTIFAGELEETQQVVFQFPVDTTGGTYPLAGEPIYTGASVIARYDDYDPATDVFLSFFENMDGTLTITEVGATISGNFTFTANATDPDGNTLTITASGEFQGVPFTG